MTTPDEEFLDELEVDVDVELTTIEASRPDEAMSPDQWQVDPAELEYEEASLRSLRGAIEALEGDHTDPGSARLA
ncbi:hypothetical protein OHA70_34625 [Kribbella sp. NBC_00382]|uniref:hypothetical protein n=1 Tax=Kribbella sp. NBC_00382 TaxID=2975967 RepID=UPI002E1DC5F8